MKRSEVFFGLIRIPLDFGLAVGAFFLAYKIRAIEHLSVFLKTPDLGSFPPTDEFFTLTFKGATLLIIILALFRLYTLKITVSFSSELRKIFLAAGIWLMAVITYYFLIREFPFSRLILLYSWLFVFVFLTTGRFLIHRIQKILMSYGIGKRKVCLVGEGKLAQILKQILGQQGIYEVQGIVVSLDELKMFHKRPKLDEVIQTKNLERAKAQEILDFCREHHIEYRFVPDLLEVSRTNVSIDTLDGIPLITLKKTPLEGWGSVMKRLFDIVFSVIFLVVLAPVFLFIAIAVKLDSKGPVFFYKDDEGKIMYRVGQYGRKIRCFKFRTMQVGTHYLRYSQEFQKHNLREGSPLVKIKDDPRITRAGKFLRKYSLDELPNLWNVFTGEMSLVGPRPHLTEEVSKYEGHHKFVHTIKPGITGIAQVSGRSDLPFEEEIRLDTFYIEHWSLLLDLKILVKTVFVLFRGYKE